jgi:hypothetical protein
MPLAGSQKLTDELMFSVARIECDTPSGVRCGTGFFFAFLLDNGKRSPCLITSRNLVEGGSRARFYVTRKSAEGDTAQHQALEVELPYLEDQYHPHPDPSVDMALIFVGATMQALRTQGCDYHITFLSRSAILPKAQVAALTALEGVVLSGFPVGLWDAAQHQPLLRRGITATHPALPYNGWPQCLVDVPCHDGIGGAPVFLSLPAQAGDPGQRSPGIALLGMLFAWRSIGPAGEAFDEPIVGDLPRQGGAPGLPLRPPPSALGVVLTTDRILDFEPLVRVMLHGQVSRY